MQNNFKLLTGCHSILKKGLNKLKCTPSYLKMIDTSEQEYIYMTESQGGSLLIFKTSLLG